MEKRIFIKGHKTRFSEVYEKLINNFAVINPTGESIVPADVFSQMNKDHFIFYFDENNVLTHNIGDFEECRKMELDGYRREYIPYDALTEDDMECYKVFKEKFADDVMCIISDDDEIKRKTVYGFAFMAGVEMNEGIYEHDYRYKLETGDFLVNDFGKIKIVTDIFEKNYCLKNKTEFLVVEPFFVPEGRCYADINDKFYIRGKMWFNEDIIKKMIELGGNLPYPWENEYGEDWFFVLDDDRTITVTDDEPDPNVYTEYVMEIEEETFGDEEPYNDLILNHGEFFDMIERDIFLCAKFEKSKREDIVNFIRYYAPSGMKFPYFTPAGKYWLYNPETLKIEMLDFMEIAARQEEIFMLDTDRLREVEANTLDNESYDGVVTKLVRDFYLKGDSNYVYEIELKLQSLGVRNVDKDKLGDGWFIYPVYKDGSYEIKYTQSVDSIYLLKRMYKEMKPFEENRVFVIDMENSCELYNEKKFFTRESAERYVYDLTFGTGTVTKNNRKYKLVIRELVVE